MSREPGRSAWHSPNLPAAWRVVAAGALATVVMDAAIAGAGLVGGPAFAAERLDPQIIGRWAAGFPRGRFRHGDISREDPVPGELLLGLATHYATGTALTSAYLLARRRKRDSFAAAVAYGVATAVLPLLVMFPAMGYGCCGRRSGEAARLTRIMLVGHVGFGAGIGIWAPRLVGRR